MNDEMFGEITLLQIVIIIGVLLVSMSVHEAMHAFVGLKLGDDTAAEEGRVSLNPLKHIDPFLTIVLPVITLILVGAPVLAAKPVPFNPERVKWDEFGAALIAAAGPISNFALALLGAVVVRLLGLDILMSPDLFGQILQIFIILNVGLFIFNLIPIPPLDGSRVLYAFAPEPLQRVMAQLEPFGFFIVIGIVAVGGFSFISKLNTGVLQFLL